MPDFCRYVGIDYSGAETPDASLKGLRVYLAQDDAPATEVLPPPSPRKYWTRKGIAEWLALRLAEDIPTHAGIPWLLHIRRQCPAVHFWPFDGWVPAKGVSVVGEAYPSLWRHAYPTGDRTPDQHDAYTIATGLQQADRAGTLTALMSPHFQGQEEAVAEVEGWIFGVA